MLCMSAHVCTVVWIYSNLHDSYSNQNKSGKLTPTIHARDLTCTIAKIYWCENIICIFCFDPSGVCKCVEIFLPDDEARDSTFNLSQAQTLGVFASTCSSFIHIWSYYLWLWTCLLDEVLLQPQHNAIKLLLLLYSLTYFKNVWNRWNKILFFFLMYELWRPLFL